MLGIIIQILNSNKMKAILTFACVLAATAYSVVAIPDNRNSVYNENPLDDEMPQQNGDAVKLARQIKFMSHAGRGLIAGYRRGMYKDINFKVDPKCLDGDTQK